MNSTSFAQSIEAKFSLAAPMQDTIEFCKGELTAANYVVVQVGQSKLLGCKSGDVKQFVEVTLERAESAKTKMVVLCYPDRQDSYSSASAGLCA